MLHKEIIGSSILA